VTDFTREALGVPLAATVLVLLHASAEDRPAQCAAWRKVVLVAGCTVQAVVFVRKGSIRERGSTRGAVEAFVVPMPLLYSPYET